MRKEKRSYAEVAKIYGKNESSIHVITQERELHAGFALVAQTAKVMATVHCRCLIKMEKALNLYIKIF